MRRLLLLLCLFLAPLLASRADSPLDEIRRLPEANPYRATLELYATRTEQDRAALNAWASFTNGGPSAPLATHQQEFVQKLAAGIVVAAGGPPLSDQEWTPQSTYQSPEAFVSEIMPAMGCLRGVSRLCVKLADELPPHEALPLYAAVAQLARNQRFGTTLIHHLTSVAIEGIAMDAATRRLNDYSAEEARRLGDLWKALHPTPSIEAALSGERNLYFVPILEKTVRPALETLLATAPGATTPLSPQQREYLQMFLPKDEDNFEETWLRRVKAHPKGVDGCVADLRAAYDRSLARHVGLAENPSAPTTSPSPEENAYLATTMPTIGSAARTLNRANTQAIMLQAAVHHRLVQLGAAKQSDAPLDPWAPNRAAFAHKNAPDGGFFLRSRYEIAPGEPFTCKFAAPDAGFFRVSKF